MRKKGIAGPTVEAWGELESAVTQVVESYRRYLSIQADVYRAQAEGYRLIRDLTDAYANFGNITATLSRTALEGINIMGKFADTFLSLGKAVLSSNDALSATANVLSTLSTAFQDTSQGLTTLQNLFDNVTKAVNAPLDAIKNAIQALDSFRNTVSLISYSISNLASSLTSISGSLTEMGKLAQTTSTTFYTFTVGMGAALQGIQTAITVALTTIQIDLLKAVIPLQQLNILLTRLSVQFQVAFLPLRIYLPILNSLISVLGSIIGTYGRLVVTSNELINVFAQLQGMVVSLTVYLGRTGESVQNLIERLRGYGITMTTVFEFIRTSISAGIVPLTSFVDEVARLSRQLSVLTGMTPDDIFKRLAQAVIEGNAALLQQIGIMMTEADLLNQIISRYGLLVTTVRQIHPFLRTALTMRIAREEVEGIETQGGLPLIVFVSELRAIFQTFQTYIGDILRQYGAAPSFVSDLRSALTQLFSPEVSQQIARSIFNIVGTIMNTLIPIINTIREAILSPIFQNFTILLGGIIAGLGEGIRQLITNIRTWLETVSQAVDVKTIQEWATTIGAKIAAFIAILPEIIKEFFSIVISHLQSLFNFLLTNADKLLKLFGVAAQALISAANQLLSVLSVIPGKAAGGVGVGVGGAVAGALVGSIFGPIGTIVGGIIGGLGGAGLGTWLGGKFIGAPQPPQQMVDAQKLIEELTKGLGEELKLPTLTADIERWKTSWTNAYTTAYNEALNRIREILSKEEGRTDTLVVTYRRLTQAVEPVVEHFIKLHDVLRDFFSTLTTYVGVPGVARLGEVLAQVGTFYERGLSVLSAAYSELYAASQRFAIVLYAAATGIRGVQTDLISTFQQLISSLRRFYDVLSFISEHMNRFVNSLINATVTVSRLAVIFGRVSPFAFPERVIVGGLPFIRLSAQRLGELVRLGMRFFGRLGELGLLNTIEAAVLWERFVNIIQQTMGNLARVFDVAGVALLVISEQLREQVTLFTAINIELGKYQQGLETLQRSVLVLDAYFYSLGLRIGAAFAAGNVEEFIRLSRQVIADLRTFYMERLPQWATEIADYLTAPLNLWMRGVNELRGVLQQLGAEGLIFPMMLRTAIPELITIINFLRMMRDEMFRQGLIPAATEFNNRLLQAQRTILEILGIGGMFLPAYTPEQIVRAREMMGTLPQQLLVGMLRGRLPLEVPTLRVVPPLALWQMMAFAPGVVGAFGPFVTPAQFFQLIPPNIFTGLWGGLSFLAQLAPDLIRYGRFAFTERWRTLTSFAVDLPSLLIWRWVTEGLMRPTTGGGPLFPYQFQLRNIEIGRIRAEELYVNTMRVELEETMRRGDIGRWERMRREMELGVGGLRGAPVQTVPLTKVGSPVGYGFQRGVEGGVPIMVGELGKPEIVHIPSFGRQIVSQPTLFFVPPTETINVIPTYSTYGIENYMWMLGEMIAFGAQAGTSQPPQGGTPRPRISLRGIYESMVEWGRRLRRPPQATPEEVNRLINWFIRGIETKLKNLPMKKGYTSDDVDAWIDDLRTRIGRLVTTLRLQGVSENELRRRLFEGFVDIERDISRMITILTVEKEGKKVPQANLKQVDEVWGDIETVLKSPPSRLSRFRPLLRRAVGPLTKWLPFGLSLIEWGVIGYRIAMGERVHPLEMVGTAVGTGISSVVPTKAVSALLHPFVAIPAVVMTAIAGGYSYYAHRRLRAEEETELLRHISILMAWEETESAVIERIKYDWGLSDPEVKQIISSFNIKPLGMKRVLSETRRLRDLGVGGATQVHRELSGMYSRLVSTVDLQERLRIHRELERKLESYIPIMSGLQSLSTLGYFSLALQQAVAEARRREAMEVKVSPPTGGVLLPAPLPPPPTPIVQPTYQPVVMELVARPQQRETPTTWGVTLPSQYVFGGGIYPLYWSFQQFNLPMMYPSYRRPQQLSLPITQPPHGRFQWFGLPMTYPLYGGVGLPTTYSPYGGFQMLGLPMMYPMGMRVPLRGMFGPTAMTIPVIGLQRGGRVSFGGEGLSFDVSSVRVPITFEISLDIRDSRSGDVIETLTREISTVVHLNPRILRRQK